MSATTPATISPSVLVAFAAAAPTTTSESSVVFVGPATASEDLVDLPGPATASEKLLGGRLVRSGVIYRSRCVEGLIVVGVVYIGC